MIDRTEPPRARQPLAGQPIHDRRPTYLREDDTLEWAHTALIKQARAKRFACNRGETRILDTRAGALLSALAVGWVAVGGLLYVGQLAWRTWGPR